MPLLDEIIGWAGGLRPWQQEALRRIFARAELTQDDIETILRMVREQEREDATTGEHGHSRWTTYQAPEVAQPCGWWVSRG
ncbi:hypothetical protein NUITMVA1_06600 [Aeromonas hydrophila]|nr:hypothetical protein NUITMVA1_06600 [Aeromonas hydrophila]